MKKENGYFVEAREIEFGRMIWFVLKKWRCIIVLALIGAIAATAWKYSSDYKQHQSAYEEALRAQTESDQRMSIEELESQLSEKERIGVYRAQYYAKRAEEAGEYLEQSILMQENPYAQNVEYIYLETDTESVTDILQYIYSDEFIQKTFEKTYWDTESRYVRELISAETEEGTVVITITGVTEEDCAFLGEIVTNVLMEKYSTVVQKEYHTEDIIINMELVKLYNEIFQDRNTSSEIFASYDVYFTEWQRQLYDALNYEEAEVDVEAESVEIELESTYINKKMLIFGALAGVVLAVVILGIYYTFSSAIHGQEEMKRLFDLEIIGNVNTESVRKRRWFRGVDRLIDRIGSGKGKYLTYEKQLQLVASYIYLSCSKKQIQRIYVTGTEAEKLCTAFTEQLVKELKEKGIEATMGKSIVSDAEALLEAASYPAVVLAEIDEKSKCAEIANELNLCLTQGIESLGVIMVQA